MSKIVKCKLILNIFNIYFMISLLLTIAINAQEIKIKNGDEVVVVNNPINPIPYPGSPKELILIEDLTLSDNLGNKDYLFQELRYIQVDNEGNIYALDSKEACINVFDKDGNLIRKFGKKGQGPGEMQSPSRMHIVDNKEIMIYDVINNRLSFYSLQGDLIREISTGKYRFGRVIVDSQGNIIGYFFMLEGNKMAYELKKFDSELNPLFSIATLEIERIPSTIQIEYPTFIPFVLKNDNIVWANNAKYEIYILSPKGYTVRKIIKNYEPVKFSDTDKEQMIKDIFRDRGIPPGLKIEFPKHFFPFSYLFCGDEGYIYVRTYEKDKKGGFYYDVFNPEGRYILKFSLPAMDFPIVVKKNKLYSLILENEEGLPVVKRYEMKWR